MSTDATTAQLAAPLVGLPSESDWNRIMQMAQVLSASGLVPTKTPEATAAIMLKGAELGVPPMAAFSQISVIQGKPTVGSELQLALLARGQVTWSWLQDGSDGEAVIQFDRPGFGKALGRFSMDDAKAAGLSGKDNWKKWPRNMLRARAISDGARQIGPDLLNGASYTHEELGAEVDENGAVVAGASFTVAPPQPAQAVEPAPAPPVEADPEFARRAELWAEVKRLKAQLDDDPWYYTTLEECHDVTKATKAGDIGEDQLTAIINTLTNEGVQRAHFIEEAK
jgi:hypothetical protein